MNKSKRMIRLHEILSRAYRGCQREYNADMYYAISGKGEWYIYLTQFGIEYALEDKQNIYLPYRYSGYRVAIFSEVVP